MFEETFLLGPSSKHLQAQKSWARSPFGTHVFSSDRVNLLIRGCPLCDLGPLPLHYPYFKTIYSTKFMGTMFISSIRTITTKAHVYYPWRNYSFCWDEQAQRSPTTRPRRDSPTHVLISATKAHLST